MNEIPLREWIAKYDSGAFDSPDIKVQCEAGWFDWFCKDTSLAKKTKSLAPKVKKIAKSPKIDVDKTYVFFKNNCPMRGSLYDDFRVCDRVIGDVIYTIIPRSGFTNDNGRAEVWGRENSFLEPLVAGTWKEVLAYFNV